MNSTERLKRSKYLTRGKAFSFAEASEQEDPSGRGAARHHSLNLQSHAASGGWTVTLGSHVDLCALAELCGKHGLGMLYRPFGGDGWPDVMIYDLAKAAEPD